MASQADVSPLPVILWCVPRSVSTATERAFMTREDTRCWHEPLGDPFYFSQKRQSLRYTEEECKSSGHWDKDIVDVMQTFLKPGEAGGQPTEKKGPFKHVFIKDMAQYIMPQTTLKRIHQGSRVYDTPGDAGTSFANVEPDAEVLENPTVIPTALMRRFKHAFLIRTPSKAVPSYYKCVQDKMAGFEYFDGAEAGFEEVRILYKWISNPESTFNKGGEDGAGESWPGKVQSQPQPPPLIDASVLLASPVETIKHLCEQTGIPFEDSMLSWDAKPQAEFAKWGAYHQGAENSTGFKAEAPAAEASAKGSTEEKEKKPEAPKEVRDTIERNMEPYNWLFARKTVHSA
ncbi:unnamed protein product [Parajaminaea phylloscopi]